MTTNHLNVDGWRLSSFTDGVQCVAVKPTEDGILVRHSKTPAGAVLNFTPGEMSAFIQGVKAGEFDDLTV